MWVYVVIGALVLLITLIVLISWLIYLMVTIETTRLFMTQEAHKNRWLAISTLGERYGVTVNPDSTLARESMPAPTDTIILEDVQSSVVSETVSDELETWVLQGGTLIFRLPVINLDSRHNTLDTQYFPNKLMVFEEGSQTIFDRIFEHFQDLIKESCLSDSSSIWFADGDVAELEGRPTRLVNTSFSPYAPNLESLSKLSMLRLSYGHGQVYFVTDLSRWSNHSANCADNAYVFLRLVRGTVNLLPGLANEVSVWIIPRAPIKTTGFLDLVWTNFHVPIIGVLLTFLVAMIALNVRSSPAVHAVPVPRRATIDYVTSVSEFAWRKNEIERFFHSLLWVSENPTGVFGPTKARNSRQQQTQQTNTDRTSNVNVSPTNEVDLVVNVQKLQAKLRQNMQPSIRKS